MRYRLPRTRNRDVLDLRLQGVEGSLDLEVTPLPAE